MSHLSPTSTSNDLFLLDFSLLDHVLTIYTEYDDTEPQHCPYPGLRIC